MLDPAVEMLEVEIDENRLLCNSHFEVGMALPPGEGLLDFVATLTGKPISIGAIREQFDDQQIIDKMLTSLYLQGFIHKTSQVPPSIEEFAHLRNIAAQTRKEKLRRSIVINLDAPMSIEHLRACLNAEDNAPELFLRCERLADHKEILAELARLRQVGSARMHRTVLQTKDLRCDDEICRSIIRLGASVNLEEVPWSVPKHPIIGFAELTRNCVAVHAVMTPDLSILEKTIRDYVLEWARSVFVSGLCLQLEADALWQTDDVKVEDFISVFKAVKELEDEIGDVQIVNLPSDEVLLGNTASSTCLTQLSDLANRFRQTYLRWRLPILKSFETDNTWSQTPEAEEKLVNSPEDFLPNHPELLGLRQGSYVVDVCGGLGRVARRLSPAVGQEGLIISIEMLRCLSDHASHFACEKNMFNLHFRPGLAQRIPLPNDTVDAAVNEWTGGIWELGIGPAMVKEMARVVRPGGRIAVTHRLVRLPLNRLGQPWVQYEEIYNWMRDAFTLPDLTIITERVWGQIASSLAGENATHWRKQYMPHIINRFDLTYDCDDYPGSHADIYLTIIAQRQ